MAVLIRSHAWERTAVGPVGSWPEALRSAVNVMLGCGFPTAIWWGGGEGPQLYNDDYRAFLGTKHPLALGQRAKDCWREAWDLVKDQVQSVMDGGRPLTFENSLVPIYRNGVLEDVYWRYSYSPIFGVSGKTEGVLVIGHDVTDVVVAVRKLRESTEELQGVLKATNDAIVTVDREWRLTYFNPRAAAMFDPDGVLLGQTVWEAFPDAVYEGSPYVEHYYRAMDEGVAGHFEAHYPEPLDLWLDIEVVPTENGIATFARDVTELKRATAALLQNEKLAAVGRLAASIAHEINNPLESVTNLLYLARGSGDAAEAQHYLALAERELRRVSVISNQTLRFYKQSTDPTLVRLEALLDEVLSVYQGRLVNSQIRVERRKRTAAPVECFEGEIRQVLSNLVGNAIDAMHQGGGRLVVGIRGARDWRSGQRGVALTVADTGHGMPPGVLRKVFEAFYTTKGIGGTGLGLWVSREIVDRHLGTLRVRSSTNERHSGTVFVLFLPQEAAGRERSLAAAVSGAGAESHAA